MAEQKRPKTFKMDVETERRLVLLAKSDERSQSAEVRHLINSEWRRRGLHRVSTPVGSAPAVPAIPETS